jgi:hypothetical protein
VALGTAAQTDFAASGVAPEPPAISTAIISRRRAIAKNAIIEKTIHDTGADMCSTTRISARLQILEWAAMKSKAISTVHDLALSSEKQDILTGAEELGACEEWKNEEHENVVAAAGVNVDG